MLIYRTVKHLFVFYLAFLIANGPVGFSCPCGCGSNSPLSLSHGERFKLQVGLTREFSPEKINRIGDSVSLFGMRTIDTLNLGMAHSLSEQLSWSLLVPFKQNYHPDFGTNQNVADPSLSLNWVLLGPNYLNPWQPQVDMKIGVKAPLSLSTLDRYDIEPIKIYGNGFWEVSPAIQLWFYEREITIGSFYELIWRNSRRIILPTDSNIQTIPGYIHRANASISYNFIGTGQLRFLVQREKREEDLVAGIYDKSSERIRYEGSLQGSLRVGMKKTISVSYSQRLPFIKSMNTPFYKTVSISYLQSI